MRDLADRRRWDLKPIAETGGKVIELLEPLRNWITAICADFSDDQTEQVAGFLARRGGDMDREAAALRSET